MPFCNSMKSLFDFAKALLSSSEISWVSDATAQNELFKVRIQIGGFKL